MNDRRLAAGSLLGSFRGTDAPGWLLDLLAEGLGGVVLFADNVIDDDQLRALCSQLTDARANLVIAMDEEAGDVTRLDARTGSALPGHAALGAIDDPATTTAVAMSLGHRLADIGVTLNLAPCADVNVNPDNPIVGTRAFSADNAVAERHVPAFVAGLQGAGVAACVKHFPGHGGTSLDSHAAAPVLDESWDDLLAGPLRPFASAISAGAHSVMTGHLLVPAVDDLPASISPRWTEILRSTLKFDGVIVTDALDMGAVAGEYGTTGSLPVTSIAALAAGADLLCLASKLDREPIEATIDAIVAALQDGRLDRGQLDTSRQRITDMQRITATTRHQPAIADDGTAAASGRSIAARALRIEGGVPSSPTGLVIECRPEPNLAVGVTGWGLVDVLAGTGWFGQQLQPGQMPGSGLADIVAGPLVVVVRDAARDQWQHDVIAHCAAQRSDLIVVEMGWPGPTNDSIRRRICTFGASRASAEAVMHHLTGGGTHQQPHVDSTSSPMSIGVDIGGTTTRAALVDQHGTVANLMSRPTVGGEIGVVDGTVELIENLMEASSTRLDDIDLIGIGIPGMVDASSGTVRHAVNVGLGTDPINLQDLLARRLGRSVCVNNDVNVAALGAAHELRERDPDPARPTSIAYLGVGTGIAAAWVSDNGVWNGAHGAAGEIGHISIDQTGPLCECGQRGCLEALSSGAAIARRWPTDDGSPIEHLMTAADADRTDAIEIWDSVVEGLAHAVLIVTMSIDPHTVILGGGIANHRDRVVPAIAAALRERASGSTFLTSLNIAERLRAVRDTDEVGVVGAVIAARTAARSNT